MENETAWSIINLVLIAIECVEHFYEGKLLSQAIKLCLPS